MTRLTVLVALAATAAGLVAVPATGKGVYVATMWGRSGHALVPQAGRVIPLMACAPATRAPRRAPFYTILFSVAAGTSVRHFAVLYAPSVHRFAGNRAVPGLGWRRASPALEKRLRSATAKLSPYRTPRTWPPGMKSPLLGEFLSC